MKRLLPLGLGLLLTGCSALTQDIKESWDYARHGPGDVVLTAEEIANFPYTAVYARMGEQAQSLMVLGFVDPGHRLRGAPSEYLNWLSAGGETLTTSFGRIVRSTGLAANLAGSSALAHDPLPCFLYAAGEGTGFSACPTQWQRTLDVTTTAPEDGAGSYRVESTFTLTVNTEITLPSGTVQGHLLTEQGQYTHSGRTFTNRFWFAADGHVLKSEQHIVPQLPAIQMTQVKWIGRDD